MLQSAEASGQRLGLCWRGLACAVTVAERPPPPDRTEEVTAISAEVEASRVLMEGLIEELKHDLDRKVGVNDLHQNFTQLNDILFARFKQLEEAKLATRKLIAYQKYYQPINMQQLISDNLTYLKDPGFLAHQKQLYDKVTGAAR